MCLDVGALQTVLNTGHSELELKIPAFEHQGYCTETNILSLDFYSADIMMPKGRERSINKNQQKHC